MYNPQMNPGASSKVITPAGILRRSAKVLALAVCLIAACALRAQTPIISDFGPSAPTPGPDDQYQLNSGGGNPSGLNYYFDNSSPPGQTFTTGNNPNGYILNTLTLGTAGGSGNLPAGGQAYVLRIYRVVNTTNASLLAAYTSQGSFTFTDFDWLQWTNLGATLLPNTQYAYSLHRVSAGWENMGNVSGDTYPAGAAATIPSGGGVMNFGTGTGYDAAFDVGLNVATNLQVGTPSFAPSGVVTNGVQVTINSTVVGPAPFYFQWRTDGGTGGALTNIPGATNVSLSVDTTSFPIGFYVYTLIVTNSTSTVTSAPATLVVSSSAPATAAGLSDLGQSVTSGAYDIFQLTGDAGGSYDSVNYYTDNGANNNAWAGQTFTTGTNSQGYYLNTVSLQTGGGTSSATTNLQPYHLYIYQVDGNFAATIAHLTNGSFGFIYGDWLQWSGFSVVLKSNTTYAYGFGRASGGAGWAGLNASSTVTDRYTGGQISAIPAGGGSVSYGTVGTQDGVFDLGLLPIGVGPSPLPFGQPIKISPAAPVVAGTPITLTEFTTNGTPPYHYQWQTDGGTGGALTNIAATDLTNLVLNTTGWLPGVYHYDVVVQNAYGSSTSVVSSVTILFTNSTAIMTDIGSALPTPLANDINQLSTPAGANSPDGLNYYFDNATPPGQTFTTGANPSGYTMTSVAIDMAGNSGQLPAAGQTYLLRIYKMSGSTATPYAILTSQTNSFSTTDWLRWSGFAVPLAPNSTYAYSLGRISTGAGWDNLANVTGNLYSGGEVALIPVGGGNIVFGSSHSYDGTFNVGLSLAGYPAVGPAVFSPSNSVYGGTPITAAAAVSGTGTLTYQWQTDGGSGGALTNIPGATSATLPINTAGLDGQTVAYDLVVTSGANSTTSELSTLTVAPASGPVVQTDISPLTASAFPGASVTFSASFVGDQPITYQWQVDKGTGPTNIVGQNSSTLTLPSVQMSDAGTYFLVASNSLSFSSSSGGTLTMNPNPTGRFTVNFQWLSTQGGNNAGSYNGPGIPGYGTGTYWNMINGPAANNGALATYTSSSGLDDAAANNIGVSMTVSTPESWDWTSTPVIPLLDSAVTARSTLPFSFSLPNGRYNIVLFSCNGTESSNANAGAQITLAGVTQTALPTQDTNFVLGNNYLVFPNVVVTNGILNGTITPAAGKAYGSLNGAQVQYLGQNVVLQFKPVSAGALQLQWSQGILLQATNLGGPWTTNNATPPYTVPPVGPQMFFRLLLP
jgi:hypothetical protein